jgi:pSer/pThr/pTyr-binding forkhead associated (FHA) protein
VTLVRRPTQVPSYFPEPEKWRPAAWLVCESGAEAGHIFPVDQREYWIGSLDNNHLQIEDATVSANHACIAFDHNVLGIYDYQSTNGTRVNDELVKGARRLLRPGDRIRIGSSVFVLRAGIEGGQ